MTKIARSMVTAYGMSNLVGPIALSYKEELAISLGRDFGEQRNCSEQTAREVDEEVRALIHAAYKDLQYLATKQDTPAYDQRTLDTETLEGPAFEALFNQRFNEDQYEGPSVQVAIPDTQAANSGEKHIYPCPMTPIGCLPSCPLLILTEPALKRRPRLLEERFPGVWRYGSGRYFHF